MTDVEEKERRKKEKKKKKKNVERIVDLVPLYFLQCRRLKTIDMAIRLVVETDRALAL